MAGNARRMLNRRFAYGEGWDKGTRNRVRAAEPPKVRLRCNGPIPHTFKAASRMRCPMCQHETIEVGSV